MQSGKLGPKERWRLELPLWALSMGASTWLIDLEPYAPSCVVGLVRRLCIDPGGGYIEATVTDGTAEVAARWPARGRHSQLVAVPGRAVVLHGIATVGRDGLLTFCEPRVEAIDVPEVA